ncbi:MAG TPA: SDR family NAD(P)-dependent oxidoreductase [Euzebyales bacterium]|nr:SDR family NAD(P)-dependent oxidoreductase [Euzebyales bacterium]
MVAVTSPTAEGPADDGSGQGGPHRRCSSGIGAALARAFVPDGHRVVLQARSVARLTAPADELGTGRAVGIPGDVTEPGDQQRAVDVAIDRFGRLDVAVANAGGGTSRGFLDPDADPLAWRGMILTNVYGVALTARAALPHLVDSSGHLVLMGSVAGRVTIDGSLYSATKWAVTGMAQAIRAELHRHRGTQHRPPGTSCHATATVAHSTGHPAPAATRSEHPQPCTERRSRRRLRPTRCAMDPWAWLFTLAVGQCGAVARRQALGLGIAASTFDDRVCRERWLRPHRGVLLIPGTDPTSSTVRVGAALAAAADGALATGWSGPYLHDVMTRPPPFVSLVVPWATSRRHLHAVRTIRSRTLLEEDRAAVAVSQSRHLSGASSTPVAPTRASGCGYC